MAAAVAPCIGAAGTPLPFEAGLNADGSFESFVIVDGNSDGVSWMIDPEPGVAFYEGNPSHPANDWLISPEFDMATDVQYRLTITVTADGRDCPEQIEARLGEGTDPVSYSTQILRPVQIIMNSTEPAYVLQSPPFSPGTSSGRQVALHVTSWPHGGTLTVTGFRLEEVPADAPHAVIDFQAKPAEDGACEVELSFISPTFSHRGEPLQEPLTKIEIYRNGTLLHTFRQIEPATPVTYTDKRSDLTMGYTRYDVIAYCGDAQGELAGQRVFVGHDIPLPVENISVADKETYLSVAWNAVPAVGRNGGPVFTSDIYYNLYLATPIYEFGQLTGYDHTYLKRIKGRRTDIDVHNLNLGDIEPLLVAVNARNGSGESTPSYFPFLKGAPYMAPYAESFAGCQAGSYIEIDSDNTDVHSSALMTPRAADDDHGALALLTSAEAPRVSMSTAKIDIRHIDEPVLRFSVSNPSERNTLEVSIIAPDYKPLLIHSCRPTGEYEEMVLPLSAFKNERWIRVRFTSRIASGEGEETPDAMFIDAISVRDRNDSGTPRLPEVDAPLTPDTYSIDGYRHHAHPQHGLVIINRRARLLR